LRTYEFWENQISVRIIIILLGLTTSIVATLIARVQSTVKSQIAYSSAAQIGLIFIEIALGLEDIALVHFAGNAFLRTYQLLVSPSVVSYMIREQFYNFVPRHHTFEDSLPKKIEYSIYLLSLKEWNLDSFLNFILWTPLKSVGRKLNFLTIKRLIAVFIPAYLLGIVCYFYEEKFPKQIHEYFPTAFAFIGLIMVIKSYSERKSPRMSFLLIILNHFWITLAISFNEYFQLNEALFYLSGIVVAGSVGYIILYKLKKLEPTVDVNQLYGHVYEHPKLAFIFLLSVLSITGFPITPTFIGEDLVFSHIHEDQVFLAFFISSSFILSGIAMLRLYAKLFLGPHVKTYHETPYRSS
jgi:NADH:ubiquinone oxidoreductase subunit 5 (subunit L)/multisubunit Na+/H+ antiporter MnhA subunit